jgi:lysophospholipase L1-like esterase
VLASWAMKSARVLAAVVLSLTASSAVADPAPPAAQFEDPCVVGAGATCTRALDGFYRALAATEDGTAPHATRISYLGDSLTADDQIAQHLRDGLRPRFGDGGPGFLYVVPPHKYCRARTVKRSASSSWKMWGVATPFPADRLLGFGGGSVESQGGATVHFTPKTPVVTTADVYYLTQPNGGTLTVTADGAEVATIDTNGAAKKAGFGSVPLPGVLGRIDLKAAGKVRLFGVVLEAATGIVVDNLGVVNATAKAWDKNRRDHWQGQLAHRAPDLFIVMIGANEAGWLAGDDLADYQNLLQDLVAPVRKANPTASCLLISPFDQIAWDKPGGPARTSIPTMVEANRIAAAAVGCGFWDAYTWMGGASSSRKWRKAGWMTNDFAHPSPAGDRRISAALLTGLLDGYAGFRAR